MKYFTILQTVFLLIVFNLTISAAMPEPMSGPSLSGYVVDSTTKETLIGATVYIVGTKLGAYTNKSGFFSITGIPEGKHTIKISSLSYEKKEVIITFKENESVRKTFELKPNNITTKEVTVEAEKEIEKREITISKINIPAPQLRQIRIGGETDVFRSLQYLPGILTSSQLSSGLFVRGGSPDQNLVLVDGSVVYNPSHLFGFISTFNTDAVKDVELIKGGFPAEYGSRLSAVLNVTQKDGNREKFEGLASIGVLSSRAALEGPIGNGSWFISGRRTYLELLKEFIPDDPESPLPDFHFYDLNAKISQDITDNDKVFLSGFMSSDNLNMKSSGVKMDMGISNKSMSARWTHIFGSSLFSVINFSASNYINGFTVDQSGYAMLMKNSITDYTIKGSLEWFASEKLTAKFGFESTNFVFKYLQNYSGDTDTTEQGISKGKLNLSVPDWTHSIYGQLNYRITDLLSLQAGLRTNYWDIAETTTFDPRFALRWQFQDNIALKAAWGMFHQYLHLSSLQDFSFFDTWLPTDSTIAPSRAFHYILSLETVPYDGYNLNFDVYYKRMNNINEMRPTFEGKVVADLFFVGDADAYGAEVFLQRKVGKFTGWLGYALGYIYAQFDSINGGKEFRPKYDRRHDLKIVASYQLNDRWELGASFSFQSGQSYTGATSRFQTLIPGQTYGMGKIIPTQRYGLRLPNSHQLNINAAYSFETFGLQSKLVIDIFNVYNRRDIWFRYYDMTTNNTEVKDVRLLPIIPTLSYEVKF